MPHPDMSESWVNGHPDEGLLHEWLDEQLSAEHSASVATHVASCAECSAQVAEARGLIAAAHRILTALDDVPANVIPVPPESATQDRNVVNLATAREAHNSARRARDEYHPSRTSTGWTQLAKVAAVLLVAVIPAFMFLRGNFWGGDDVTVPFSLENAVGVSDSSAGVAPVSAAPAAGAAAIVAAREVDNAGNAVATLSSPVIPRAKTAATSDASGVGRAEAERAMPSARTFAKASPPADSTSANTSGRARAEPGAVGGMLAGRAAGAVVGSTAAGTQLAMRPPTATPPTAAAPVASLPPPLPVGAATPPAGGMAAQSAASPPVVAADQLAQLQTSSAAGGRGGVAGGRGATRVVENAPSGPVRQIGVSPTSALASTATRPDSATLAREIADVAKRLSAGDSSARPTPQQAQGLQRPAISSVAPFAEMRRAVRPRARFESVTLTRTNCAASCETVVLHINNPGLVRYSVSSGSTTKPAVTSQLSSAERDQVSELLAASIAESVTLSGQLRCTVSRATGSPQLEVLIVNGPVNRARGEARCVTASAELLRLGAAIDLVVDADALRRRVP